MFRDLFFFLPFFLVILFVSSVCIFLSAVFLVFWCARRTAELFATLRVARERRIPAIRDGTRFSSRFCNFTRLRDALFLRGIPPRGICRTFPRAYDTRCVYACATGILSGNGISNTPPSDIWILTNARALSIRRLRYRTLLRATSFGSETVDLRYFA